MPSEELPLPFGWVKQWDANNNHAYWVDSKANPPRAIWTHPYEDPQFLDEHPDVREKMQSRPQSDSYADSAPAYSESASDAKLSRDDNSWAGDFKSPDRDSKAGRDYFGSSPPSAAATDGSNEKGKKKQSGFFGKFKDLAVGSKEEKEAIKAQKMHQQQQQAFAGGYPGAGYGPTQSYQGYAQSPYGPSPGPSSPYGHPGYNQPGPSYSYGQFGPQGYPPQQGYGYGQPMYGPPMGYPQRKKGSSAMPILAGAAGGLLLGELLF